MEFLYGTALGRIFLKILLHSKMIALMSACCHCPLSVPFINFYIRKNKIDMSDFKGQKYRNFAEFFARKKESENIRKNDDMLISPCDGLMSIYDIKEGKKFRVKNTWYTINELLQDDAQAEYFDDGICFILRLRASDYHHFCYIDDCYHERSYSVPGKLHSVQPIAVEKFPVYKINKRTWSTMNTKNFGKVVQIEFGAVLVGGIVHEKNESRASKGEEMGHFELAGSTIMLLFGKDIKERLHTEYDICGTETEVPVKMGEVIGTLKK